MTQSDIAIFSDGGAIGNPGPGGFGVVIEADGKNWRRFKGYRRTTNNRMELMGVIAGLESTMDWGKGRKTEVVSDSSYVVNGMSKGWAKRWRANGWRRNKQGDMALNPDLWGRLLDAVESRDVAFRWVKGHAGHRQNEECDAMVREASRLPRNEQLIDTGYERTGSAATVQTPSFESLVLPIDSTDETAETQPELTHIDSSGEARMVDVGAKAITERVATASCEVIMTAKTLFLVKSGGDRQRRRDRDGETCWCDGWEADRRVDSDVPQHPDLADRGRYRRVGGWHGIADRGDCPSDVAHGRGDGGDDSGVDGRLDGLRHVQIG